MEGIIKKMCFVLYLLLCIEVYQVIDLDYSDTLSGLYVLGAYT
jgi:hypothetical protein